MCNIFNIFYIMDEKRIILGGYTENRKDNRKNCRIFRRNSLFQFEINKGLVDRPLASGRFY